MLPLSVRLLTICVTRLNGGHMLAASFRALLHDCVHFPTRQTRILYWIRSRFNGLFLLSSFSDWTEEANTFQNRSSSSPQFKSTLNKVSDGAGNSTGSTKFKSSSSSAFLMPSFGNSSGASPTFPLGIRSLPPTPHIQNHSANPAFGPPHYSPFLFSPRLYPYYHSQQSASQSFSPKSQSQNSPISSFLVPNLPGSASPSAISSLPPPSSALFDGYGFDSTCKNNDQTSTHESDVSKENFSSSKLDSSTKNIASQVIDLTSNRSEVQGEFFVDQQTKSQGFLPFNKSESKSNPDFAGLKRKSSLDDPAENSKQNGTSSHAEQSGLNASRKHRILKPPNINISECEYQNGLGSAFMPSPLFSQHFPSNIPSSPFTYLDHIPLSAPPIPPSHQSTSKCFNFSSQHDALAFTPPPSNGLSAANSNQYNLLKFKSSDKLKHQANSLNSIMKDNKTKKSSSSINSESKVTFQVPKPLNKEQENRFNRNDKVSQDKNRKNSQYPEYFKRGSTIKLGNGSLKKIEDLSTEDFIQSASCNGKFKVELSEIVFIKEKLKKGIIRISFLVGHSHVKVSLDSPVEHPFYVYKKGWCSYSPVSSSRRYGLNCHQLNVNDIVVTLANRSTPNRPSKSLDSSCGSLSSSSSSSSANSLNAIGSVYSTTNGKNVSLHKLPPPAHLNETSHKSLLKNSIQNGALNLESKRKSCKPTQYTNAKSNIEDEDEEIDVERVDEDCSTTDRWSILPVPIANSPVIQQLLSLKLFLYLQFLNVSWSHLIHCWLVSMFSIYKAIFGLPLNKLAWTTNGPGRCICWVFWLFIIETPPAGDTGVNCLNRKNVARILF